MIISCKQLLIITCISCSLYAMDNPTISNTEITPEKKRVAIADLYNLTHSKLADHFPNNSQSTINLLTIIEKTIQLRQKGINEKEIGLFAFNQKPAIVDQISAYREAPHNGPLYVSVFFERLAQYNAHLEKNEFFSPTYTQYKDYKSNKAIEKAAQTAATFNLFIHLDQLHADKQIFTPVPIRAATEAFDKLMIDTFTMRQKNPEQIASIAHLLYGTKTAL
jgi:hypothetical protein